MRPTNGVISSTAASKIIDTHYEISSIRNMWTTERVNRLAKMLNFTLGEISSILAHPHKDFMAKLKKRQLSGPACVLLTLIEHTMLGELLGDTVDIFNFNTNG
jgi:hypothetical protein